LEQLYGNVIIFFFYLSQKYNSCWC